MPPRFLTFPVLAVVAAACSDAPAPSRPALESPERVDDGYPTGVVEIELEVDLTRQKRCLATFVHARWILTAAHCLSEVRPGSRVRIWSTLTVGSVDDTWFHPEALRSGEVRFTSRFDSSSVIAAHDLALLRVQGGAEEPAISSVWDPALRAAPVSPGTELTFGRKRGEREQTGYARAIGLVRAHALLGPDQAGRILAAQGAAAMAGDSGGGVFTSVPGVAGTLDAGVTDVFDAADGGVPPAESSDSMLVGVMQNANAEAPREPFGVVPIWLSGHVEWMRETIMANPAP